MKQGHGMRSPSGRYRLWDFKIARLMLGSFVGDEKGEGVGVKVTGGGMIRFGNGRP